MCRLISLIAFLVSLLATAHAPAIDTIHGAPSRVVEQLTTEADLGVLESTETFSAAQNQEIERRIASALRSQSNRKPAAEFGYDNGFVITSPADVHTDPGAAFTMRINSWMQFRHTAFDSQTANPDENDLEFERLRLTFRGNVYSPDIRYFLQFDGDSDQGEVSDWLDYVITADLGHVSGLKQGRFGIKVGKWKLPFSRARAEAGWKMQFADRSVASVFFDINRSQAVGLFGSADLLGRDVHWETAISNGFKTSGARPGRFGLLDRNFGYSGRIWSDWIGEWGNDGEADLSYHECLAMRVGAGFAHARVDREGTREFLGLRVVDSGELLALLLPPAVTSYDVTYYALDANWKYRGASVITEYYFRSLGQYRGANIQPALDHGFMIQAGKFVLPRQLEFVARWSRVVGDSGTLGGAVASTDEVAGGVVWYLNGQRAKLTFDITRLNGAPIFDSSLNILPGDDGMLYRSQFQLYF